MLAGIISDATDRLDEWSSHWWFLLVIFAIAFLDSVIPIVPSETCVIIGGVATRATGDATYGILAVILAGGLGAFLGDNTAYLIGRKFTPAFERRAARKEKFRERLQWARDQIQLRGGMLLITARFIPGGRTVLTLTCGITEQRRRWFATWVAVAAVIWASYAALLGRVGGEIFKDNHTAAFLVAFGLALGVNILIEVIRHFRKRSRESEELPIP
jgi:membrane protein DedA with SNARE-associated domain